MQESVSFDKELKDAIKESVTTLSKAVKSTLGPAGTNVMVLSEINLPIVVNDGVTVAKKIKLKDPLQNHIANILKTVSQNTDNVAGDGPQPLWSKVLTPHGFIEMRNIKQGDIICGTNNTRQMVTGVYPKGKKKNYKITFSEGQFVECCEDHLWNVTTNYGSLKTLPLKELIKDYKKIDKNGNVKYKYYTPTTSVDFIKSQDFLELNPYFLGLLLGDGSATDSGIELALGKDKSFILKSLNDILPTGVTYTSTFVEEKNYYRIKFKGLKFLLQNLNLFNVKADKKFIPKKYLYADKYNRKQLLQGLIDTDGYVNKRGLIEYSTISWQLKQDFLELCRGLNKTVRSRKHNRKNDKDSFSDNPIYRIQELKGYKYGNKIVKIEETGIETDMQCIKVSNADSLYITDNYIVTHNTTTATTLTEAIILDGLKYIEAGFSPVNIVKGIHEATKQIITELETKAIPVVGNKDLLLQVASISANNDSELGKIISEAFLEVGPDGQIEVKDSTNDTTYVEVVNGMKYSSGFESNLFVNSDNGTVKLDNCSVFIYEGKLLDLQPIEDLIKDAVNNETGLFIIADDYGPNVIDTLSNIKIQHKLKVCAVKSPGYGVQKENDLEDIAFITGTQIVSNRLGVDISESSSETLGLADIIVDKESFTIISETVSKEELDQKIKTLKDKAKTANKTEKSELLERIAKLSNGVAILYVAGNSPVEIAEKKYRIEDAINATRAALEEGVVLGGGVTLLRLSEELKTPKPDFSLSGKEMEEREIGFNVLKQALKAPILTICSNADVKGDIIIDTILKSEEDNYGYNVKARRFGNLIEAGVIDPKKVTKTALTNASSVSQMILTLNCAIY